MIVHFLLNHTGSLGWQFTIMHSIRSRFQDSRRSNLVNLVTDHCSSQVFSSLFIHFSDPLHVNIHNIDAGCPVSGELRTERTQPGRYWLLSSRPRLVDSESFPQPSDTRPKSVQAVQAVLGSHIYSIIPGIPHITPWSISSWRKTWFKIKTYQCFCYLLDIYLFKALILSK